MTVLGIETSCDETSVALVRDGRTILSNIVASQIDIHREFDGVVPEIASRMHVEWIRNVYVDCIREAGIGAAEIDGIAVAAHPGLSGSLMVGLNFAKGLSLALGVPFVGVDHVLAHLYAPLLETEIAWPFLGLLVSGGHSMISVVRAYDDVEVLGASIDDACGEAFDKVAIALGIGYPGGKKVDELARRGNPSAFRFPHANLYKSKREYDFSYSGLKNAVINQRDQFWDGVSEKSVENICASFEKTAVDMLVKKVALAVEHTGLRTVVAGGGVAANFYLRKSLDSLEGLNVHFPRLSLCTDNAAMIAALGWEYLRRGEKSGFRLVPQARVLNFRAHS